MFDTGCSGSTARTIRRSSGTSAPGVHRAADSDVLRREERKRPVVDLAVGQVHLRLGDPLGASHADVADDADDRALRIREREPLADWIDARQVAVHERLADDGDHGRAQVVGLVDVAAALERNAHRGEVVRSREAHAGDPPADLRLLPRQRHRKDAAAHRHGQERDEAGVADARQRTDLLQHLGEIGLTLRGEHVFRASERRARRQHALGAEARIRAVNPVERAQQQPRPDQQRDRRRDFDRDQHRTHAQPAHTTARAFAKCVERARCRRPHRGDDAEADAGEERQHRGDRERLQIDGRRSRNRHAGGDQLCERRHGRDRDQHAAGAACQCDQQALGQELAHEPLAPGAERRSQLQLAPSRVGSRDEQVRQVGAGDQQHRERRAAERRQQRARAVRILVAQVERRAPDLLVHFRIRPLEP